MTRETHLPGKISVSHQAIATVASQAALQSYGVVGMAARNLADGIAQLLARDPRRGVEVQVADEKITIDLYVIVEFGTRISTVATSAANAVRYQVERIIDMQVEAVNVHVQDLRVSHTD